MKILSFDVGIKNLAYCIANNDEDEKKIVIEEWDIINTLEDKIAESKENNKCSHCGAKAKYYSEDSNFYCGRHRGKYCLIDAKAYKIKTKTKCSECDSNSNYTYKDINFCKKHLMKFNKLNTIKKVKCKKINNDYIFSKMIELFDGRYKHFLDCDKVLIELQPALKGPRMKAISCFISSYFLIKGKYDMNARMEEVRYISATNKLKFEETTETTYRQRKDMGIEYVRKFLEDNEDYKYFLNIFNEHSKKDDLCDALLQILYDLNIF